MTIQADLVVLAAAMCPSDGAESLAQKLNVGYDENGFLSESHPKLRPVETNAAGVFVCGACQGPKDIPESVAQATAAAGKVLVMFSRQQLIREPEVARVDETNCAACFACVRACPYRAIERAEIRDRKGQLVKRTARVNPGLVHGLRHLRGRLPLEERRPGRLFRTTDLRHGGEPGMSEPDELRTENHRLRLQLVHVPGRGPGRHEPPGISGQRPRRAPALHRAGSIST